LWTPIQEGHNEAFAEALVAAVDFRVQPACLTRLESDEPAQEEAERSDRVDGVALRRLKDSGMRFRGCSLITARSVSGSGTVHTSLPSTFAGLAGLACAACCAIPVLLTVGVLAGAGWAVAVSWMPGVAVLLAALTGAAWWCSSRRHHRGGCAGGDCGLQGLTTPEWS
jgi:hypothetical protein